MRAAHAPGIANALSGATLDGLSIADFNVDIKPSFFLEWPKRTENAPGLVAAYVSKLRAVEIATCIQTVLQHPRGLLGIHDNKYLGFADAKAVNMPSLVLACEALNDSVIFFPQGFDGAIMFDCYQTPPGNAPFSILIQGLQLTELLAHCV